MVSEAVASPAAIPEPDVRLSPMEIELKMSEVENRVVAWVSEEEIKQNLLAYLRRVEAGEAFVIIKAGKPMAEIKPVVSPSEPLRPFGLCAGEFTVPDDFDAPLPENITQEFEGQ
jgi:antitoxin (DNA-binding transcriptional repressor) of toxin-antitoxin stability system